MKTRLGNKRWHHEKQSSHVHGDYL